MKSTEFVSKSIQELESVLNKIKFHTDKNQHTSADCRVLMQEACDLTLIISDPSSIQTVLKETTNQYIFKHLKDVFTFEDMPDLIQVNNEHSEPNVIPNRWITHHPGQHIIKNIGVECRVTVHSTKYPQQNCKSVQTYNLDKFMKSESIDLPKYIIDIHSLYVDPEERRKGIGSKMIHDIIKEYGPDQLYCITNDVNFRDNFINGLLTKEKQELIMAGNRAFLIKNKFNNINGLINYTIGEAWLYTGNEIGKVVYGHIFSHGLD